jgi:hypothetical protein
MKTGNGKKSVFLGIQCGIMMGKGRCHYVITTFSTEKLKNAEHM